MKSFIYHVLSMVCSCVGCVTLGINGIHYNELSFWVIVVSIILGTILSWEAYE